ncbi:hypothetical protein BGY98DRAFT_1054088 [Russula aff. rugulosa BPL654]|nr:hypothetical protein BGY98DRAFT_1054088 [Russula aff. rugulosa BPL654]
MAMVALGGSLRNSVQVRKGQPADSAKQSSRAHVFHFYSLLCTNYVDRGPSGCIIWRTCGEMKEMDTDATEVGFTILVVVDGTGEGLKEVGRESGVSR